MFAEPGVELTAAAGGAELLAGHLVLNIVAAIHSQARCKVYSAVRLIASIVCCLAARLLPQPESDECCPVGVTSQRLAAGADPATSEAARARLPGDAAAPSQTVAILYIYHIIRKKFAWEILVASLWLVCSWENSMDTVPELFCLALPVYNPMSIKSSY